VLERIYYIEGGQACWQRITAPQRKGTAGKKPGGELLAKSPPGVKSHKPGRPSTSASAEKRGKEKRGGIAGGKKRGKRHKTSERGTPCATSRQKGDMAEGGLSL